MSLFSNYGDRVESRMTDWRRVIRRYSGFRPAARRPESHFAAYVLSRLDWPATEISRAIDCNVSNVKRMVDGVSLFLAEEDAAGPPTTKEGGV